MQVARKLGIEYREGFYKNRYVGRTFIMPGQAVRKKSVRQKLNAMSSEFKGKNVLLIDDSIVRGTTSKEIIQMARDAGALSVTFASAAPPVRFPHVYGINMPSRHELGDRLATIPEIAAELGETKPQPIALIGRIMRRLGSVQTWELVERVHALEAAGGMQTSDGSRRRTPGGVFFALVKQHLEESGQAEAAEALFPARPKKRQRRGHPGRIVRCLAAPFEIRPRVKGRTGAPISTGVFGFPREPAARVALRAIGDWLDEHPGVIDSIVLNVFSQDDLQIYQRLLRGEGTEEAHV